MGNKTEGSLRVWHIPQVPMQPFYISVDSIKRACLMLDAFVRYDQFQYDNNVKPDYANAQGLEVFKGGRMVRVV